MSEDKQDIVEEEITSIEKKLSETMSADMIKILKRLAYEISIVGLSEEEACVIVDFDLARLQTLKKNNALVQRLFDMKNLEYKRGLIKTISNKARSGDEKLALWLLESKYPGEFNRRKGSGPGADDDESKNILGAAIEFIQKQTSSDGLVSEKSGRAFLIKSNNGSNKKVPKEINLVGQAEKIVEKIKVTDI